MGRKTRRWNVLRIITSAKIKELGEGHTFTSRQMAERVSPEFEAPVNPQQMAAILGQIKVTGAIKNSRKNEGDAYVWEITPEAELL